MLQLKLLNRMQVEIFDCLFLDSNELFPFVVPSQKQERWKFYIQMWWIFQISNSLLNKQ